MLAALALTTILTLAATAAVLIYFARKVTQFMSSPEYLQLKSDLEALVIQDAAKAAEIVQLKADKVALAGQVQSLTEQLAATPVGTTDAELAALDAEAKAALDPVPSAPEEPPAAT